MHGQQNIKKNMKSCFKRATDSANLRSRPTKSSRKRRQNLHLSRMGIDSVTKYARAQLTDLIRSYLTDYRRRMAVSPASPTSIGTNAEVCVTNLDYLRAFSTQFAQKLQSIIDYKLKPNTTHQNIWRLFCTYVKRELGVLTGTPCLLNVSRECNNKCTLKKCRRNNTNTIDFSIY